MGHPAGGGGMRCWQVSRGVLLAAGKHLHVYQARQYGKPRAIQCLSGIGNFDIRADGYNLAVTHKQAANSVKLLPG